MTDQNPIASSVNDPRPLPVRKGDQEVLALLRESITQDGNVPSVRHIAHKVGITQESVRRSIQQLEKCGYLSRTGTDYSTIRLLDTPLTSTPKSKHAGTQMNPQLTPANLRTLQFVEQWIDRTGFPPTFDEIAQGLGYSSIGGVQHQVTRLTDLGYLARSSAGSHGMLIVRMTAAEALERQTRHVDDEDTENLELASGTDLTRWQLQVFMAIQDFKDSHGRTPSYRELSVGGLHTSSRSLFTIYRVLASKGYLRIHLHVDRQVTLLKRVPAHALENHMTDLQIEIMNIVQEFVEHNARMPTLQEIADRCSQPRGSTTIQYNVNKLIDRGYLSRDSSRHLVLLKRLDEIKATSATA